MNIRNRLVAEITLTQKRLFQKKNNLFLHREYLQHFIHKNKVVLILIIPLSVFIAGKSSLPRRFYKVMSKMWRMGVLISKSKIFRLS